MWAKTIQWVSAVFIVIFVMTIALQMGPIVETQFFPVVSKARILTITPTSDGQGSIIQVQFTRLRDCEYLGIAWYQRTLDGSSMRIPISIGQPLVSKEKGDIISGPWTVPIPPGKLHDMSFAKVFHKCHALWLSTTDFYP